MPYQDVFVNFWEHVKESVQEKKFAKLTMAKTIGKPNLRNIFVRPIYGEDGFKVLLKLRYRSRETEDQEDELTLDEAFEVIKAHLTNPFFRCCYLPQQKMWFLKLTKRAQVALPRPCLRLGKLYRPKKIKDGLNHYETYNYKPFLDFWPIIFQIHNHVLPRLFLF